MINGYYVAVHRSFLRGHYRKDLRGGDALLLLLLLRDRCNDAGVCQFVPERDVKHYEPTLTVEQARAAFDQLVDKGYLVADDGRVFIPWWIETDQIFSKTGPSFNGSVREDALDEESPTIRRAIAIALKGRLSDGTYGRGELKRAATRLARDLVADDLNFLHAADPWEGTQRLHPKTRTPLAIGTWLLELDDDPEDWPGTAIEARERQVILAEAERARRSVDKVMPTGTRTVPPTSRSVAWPQSAKTSRRRKTAAPRETGASAVTDRLARESARLGLPLEPSQRRRVKLMIQSERESRRIEDEEAAWRNEMEAPLSPDDLEMSPLADPGLGAYWNEAS